MAEAVNYSVENRLGCGFMNVFFRNSFFGRRGFPTKPLLPCTENKSTKTRSTINKSANKPLTRIEQRPSANPVSVSSKSNLKSSRKKPSDPGRSSTSSSSNGSRLRRESLTQASSGNILISSPKSLKAMDLGKKIGASLTGGNILRKNSVEVSQFGNIYRGTTILDPEVAKNIGNEKYKIRRFGEALEMYNQAISLDPTKATYYSNKGAALIGLGKLVEAIFECREAIRIEPSYHRAHHRLATLYFRLGEAEKAEHHYTLSGLSTTGGDIIKSRALKRHLSSCKMAMELKDWKSLLKESQQAISLGTDSAPEINSMKVEALLNLRKHKEAYEALEKGPNLDMDSCCRLLGGARIAYILTIRAQVYMVVGRYEDALAVTHQASRLDTSYKSEALLKKVKAVALSRSNGNLLFKASKFSEAIVTYNKGLELDPYNSVLLCNRAACEFKLGQFEKAVEDCTMALNVQPCYSKARLRRANCYDKLGKWVPAIGDYETLIRDTPEDKELTKYLLEARAQIRQHFEETVKMKTEKTIEDSRY